MREHPAAANGQAADLLDCVRTQNYSLTGRFFKHAREIVHGSLRFNIMCAPYALRA